jgi:hypothetical protein
MPDELRAAVCSVTGAASLNECDIDVPGELGLCSCLEHPERTSAIDDRRNTGEHKHGRIFQSLIEFELGVPAVTPPFTI